MPKAKQILNPKLKSSRHRRVRAFRLRVIARRRSRRGNLMHGHRAGQQITTSPFGLLVMTSALGHRPCWDSHRVLHLGVIARRRSRRGNLMHGPEQASRSPRHFVPRDDIGIGASVGHGFSPGYTCHCEEAQPTWQSNARSQNRPADHHVALRAPRDDIIIGASTVLGFSQGFTCHCEEAQPTWQSNAWS